jgi:hypothetical protein
MSVQIARLYVFTARFAAQYFFIRSDTAFLAAADHLGRFWTEAASAASSLPGLTPAAFRMLALLFAQMREGLDECRDLRLLFFAPVCGALAGHFQNVQRVFGHRSDMIA